MNQRNGKYDAVGIGDRRSSFLMIPAIVVQIGFEVEVNYQADRFTASQLRVSQRLGYLTRITSEKPIRGRVSTYEQDQKFTGHLLRAN